MKINLIKIAVCFGFCSVWEDSIFLVAVVNSFWNLPISPAGRGLVGHEPMCLHLNKLVEHVSSSFPNNGTHLS
jgi:hypothetical protein